MVQGRLDIVADAGKKTETRIAVMEQGQCFGVSGILECTPRIATAVAAQWDAACDAMSRETALDIACKIHRPFGLCKTSRNAAAGFGGF